MYNIYCDESCHLQNDGQKAMVLGAIWSSSINSHQFNNEIREIKIDNGLSKSFEIKWTKVSPGNLKLYSDLIDYFFSNRDLHFRVLIIPDKTRLRHEEFNQTHDDWYYKMYFDMLKAILDPNEKYCIYIDIKDTRSADKVRKLHDVLCNNIYDFSQRIIKKVQIIRSEEVELMQLADLLIGAVSYINRGNTSSPAKVELVNKIKELSGYDLTRTTLYREDKFNIFSWSATEGI